MIEEVKKILKRESETLDDLPPYTIVPPRSDEWYTAKAQQICQLFDDEQMPICIECSKASEKAVEKLEAEWQARIERIKEGVKKLMKTNILNGSSNTTRT